MPRRAEPVSPRLTEFKPPRSNPPHSLRLGFGLEHSPPNKAEDESADGPERIAFISGEGQLFMVKQGDAVTGRYRVIRISSDAVELSDVSAGIVRRLIFK